MGVPDPALEESQAAVTFITGWRSRRERTRVGAGASAICRIGAIRESGLRGSRKTRSVETAEHMAT
ncbi:MAG TPA: hypothetical protein DEP35_04155 [Deltaproteobacteria bacterium]|nr:hypothetical protein [Deltaproteobacteria bacterium]